MSRINKQLQAGLLLFWSLYFTIIWLSNSADALKALGLLSGNWPFASGNYILIVRVVAIYQSPEWLAACFFAGVILWEGIGAVWLWRALGATVGQTPSATAKINQALGFTMGLWAAFILADEVFLAYLLGGLSGTHFNLFLAELGTLILIRQLD